MQHLSLIASANLPPAQPRETCWVPIKAGLTVAASPDQTKALSPLRGPDLHRGVVVTRFGPRLRAADALAVARTVRPRNRHGG